MTTRLAALTLVLSAFGYASIAQQKQEEPTIPTATQWTLDAAGPVQRTAIGSVFLMHCPNARTKGTGFLLKNGLVVTNAHVVAGCDAQQMVAMPSKGSVVQRRIRARPRAGPTGGHFSLNLGISSHVQWAASPA